MVPRWLREAGRVLLATAGTVVAFLGLLFGLPLAVIYLLPSEVVTTHCPGPLCTGVLAATTLLAFVICLVAVGWLLDRGHLRLPADW